MIAIAASVPMSATTTSTSSRVKPASLRRVTASSWCGWVVSITLMPLL